MRQVPIRNHTLGTLAVLLAIVACGPVGVQPTTETRDPHRSLLQEPAATEPPADLVAGPKLPHLCLTEITPEAIPVTSANRPTGSVGGNPQSAVSMRDKRWEPGDTIRVKFITPVDPAMRIKIELNANRVALHANLNFNFVDNGKAEIRVAVTASGNSSSKIGTDCKKSIDTSPEVSTMEFGWFDASTDDTEYKRVVMHEFMHAIGFIHEQAHPEGGIPWNKDQVYKDYARDQGWDAAKVDEQVFKIAERGSTNFASYDKDSIMQYAIPAEHVTDPAFAVGSNAALSKLDKVYLKLWYPPKDKTTAFLAEGAAISLKCLGTVPGNRWLDGVTQENKVVLSPETGGYYTGTRWQVHRRGGDDINLECLGTVPGNKWLDGVTQENKVVLSPTFTGFYTGTKWRVHREGQGKAITLECLGTVPGNKWLDGVTQDNRVWLAPTTTGFYTGTRWEVN
ncbi:MAG: peptidase [Cyanobacteria bacterium RYN_339]|nr:peptidase [Cyanobacteria bacterium RYN_339]